MDIETRFYNKLELEKAEFEKSVLECSKEDIYELAFDIVYFKEAYAFLDNKEHSEEEMEKFLEIENFTKKFGRWIRNEEGIEDSIYQNIKYQDIDDVIENLKEAGFID